MIQNAVYEVGLKIGSIKGGSTKVAIDLDPFEYSFTLKDSIWQLYPRMEWSVRDAYGILQELMLFTEGLEVEVTYGYTNDFFTCPFVIHSPEVPITIRQGYMGGLVNISLVHSYSIKQEIKSLNWNESISNIVSSITKDKNFTTRHITPTLSKDTWYQYQMSDAQFITQQLLPFAYSTDSSQTPFFVFIDNHNNFNFQPYNKLGIKSLKKAYLATSNKTYEDGIIINSMQRMTPGANKLKKYRNIEFYRFNTTTGVLESSNSTITSYPENTPINQLPLIADLLLTTGTEMLYDDESTIGKKHNNLGLKFYSQRKTFFLERIICETILDPSLKAGDLIDLYIYQPADNKQEELSATVSGKYVIESVAHVWNKQGSKNGSTTFVAGRKFLKLPRDYNISQDLVRKL